MTSTWWLQDSIYEHASFEILIINEYIIKAVLLHNFGNNYDYFDCMNNIL